MKREKKAATPREEEVEVEEAAATTEVGVEAEVALRDHSARMLRALELLELRLSREAEEATTEAIEVIEAEVREVDTEAEAKEAEEEVRDNSIDPLVIHSSTPRTRELPRLKPLSEQRPPTKTI